MFKRQLFSKFPVMFFDRFQYAPVLLHGGDRTAGFRYGELADSLNVVMRAGEDLLQDGTDASFIEREWKRESSCQICRKSGFST